MCPIVSGSLPLRSHQNSEVDSWEAITKHTSTQFHWGYGQLSLYSLLAHKLPSTVPTLNCYIQALSWDFYCCDKIPWHKEKMKGFIWRNASYQLPPHGLFLITSIITSLGLALPTVRWGLQHQSSIKDIFSDLPSGQTVQVFPNDFSLCQVNIK